MTVATPDEALAQELAALESLVTLLRQEQRHLCDGAADRLPDVTEAKGALVRQLGELTAQRHAALRAAGFGGDDEGMRRWLAAGGATRVGDRWRRIRAMLADAREINRVNGLLIGGWLSRNQQAIDALRGGAGSTLYGPDGQPHGTRGGARFGAA